MIDNQDVSFLKLIMRSPDMGDGWRQVSDFLWDFVTKSAPADLVEIDADQRRVRLSPDGEVVCRYAV